MLAGRPERLGGPRDPVLRRPSLDRTAGGHGHRATGLRNKRGRCRGADGVRGLAGLGREGSNDVPAATACRCAARSRSPAPRGPSPMSTAIAIRCVSPISRTRTSRLGRPSTGGGVSQSSGPSRTRGGPLYPRRMLPATRSGSHRCPHCRHPRGGVPGARPIGHSPPHATLLHGAERLIRSRRRAAGRWPRASRRALSPASSGWRFRTRDPPRPCAPWPRIPVLRAGFARHGAYARIGPAAEIPEAPWWRSRSPSQPLRKSWG